MHEGVYASKLFHYNKKNAYLHKEWPLVLEPPPDLALIGNIFHLMQGIDYF